MIWLKSLHLAAIAVWSAGLISLPALFVQRARVPDRDARHNLEAVVRFLYVAIISPAAFVAVSSGTGLIFVRQSFEAWFSVKLALVGMMVVTHILSGLVIMRLFDKGEVYPAWRFVAVTALTTTIVASILAVVLAKPDIPNLLPRAMSEPGALRDLLAPFNPFRR